MLAIWHGTGLPWWPCLCTTPDLYYVVEFCVLLLNVIHGEDLDVNKHLCHMIGPDVTFVPQSDSSQTVSHIGQSHRPLSHN